MNSGCESIDVTGAAVRSCELPRPDTSVTRRARTVVLCVLGVVFNAFLFGPSLKLTLHGVNDFMSDYSGTRLAFTGRMYNIAENLRVQREAAGWENINHLFMRPPFDALLMWPLGQLPYGTATVAWSLLMVAAVALFCYLWPGDRRMAALACCWSFPLFHVFANGQDIAFLLVAIAFTLREVRRGREGVAGLIFSLCSIKFHLLLLVPVLIIGQRRWRFLGGLAAGGGGLFALSFVPAGWDWPVRYLDLLRNPIGNPWPEAMPNLYGLTAGLAHGGAWLVAGSIAVAVLVGLICRRGSFETGLAAVLVGGILVAPHAYLSDCAMAVPALLITLPLVASGWARNFHFYLMAPVSTIWGLVHPTWIVTVGMLAYLATMGMKMESDGVEVVNDPAARESADQ